MPKRGIINIRRKRIRALEAELQKTREKFAQEQHRAENNLRMWNNVSEERDAAQRDAEMWREQNLSLIASTFLEIGRIDMDRNRLRAENEELREFVWGLHHLLVAVQRRLPFPKDLQEFFDEDAIKDAGKKVRSILEGIEVRATELKLRELTKWPWSRTEALRRAGEEKP